MGYTMCIERLIEIIKSSEDTGGNFFLKIKVRNGEIQKVEKEEEIK